LTRKGESAVAVIEDDGLGFDPDETRDDGFGLVGMRERVALLDGRIAIEASPGSGTTIAAEVPLP
jgi:two-component system sensor histidine kinase DegS